VEFQTTAVPVETCRGLLPACLTMGPDWLPDFVYLQEGLTRIIRCTTDEFPQLAKKLLDDDGAAQSVECEALLGASPSSSPPQLKNAALTLGNCW